MSRWYSIIFLSLKRRRSKLNVGMVLIFGLLSSTQVQADLRFLPETRHHLFSTFSFFVDDQTTLVIRDGGRAWGGFGGNFALAEMEDWGWKPQLVLFASANFAFRSNSWALDFLTETFDGRFGVAVESILSPEWRLSLGMLHLSGHTADSIVDPELKVPNLGDDFIVARILYAGFSDFRLGASLKPITNSDPVRQFFAADQFAEWFPWGPQDSRSNPSPFLALGLEEDGARKIDLNFHAQLGAYVGAHAKREYRQSMRIVLGYYNGFDPRSKYARFKNTRTHFVYGGLMFNL